MVSSLRQSGHLVPFWNTVDAGLFFTPASITGLVQWLNPGVGTLQSSGGSPAVANGDPVGFWTDQSAAGNSATAMSNLPVIQTNSFGSLPGVLFNGTNNSLAAPDAASLHLSAMTVFMVINFVTFQSGNGNIFYGRRFDSNAGTTNFIFGTPATGGDIFLYNGSGGGASSSSFSPSTGTSYLFGFTGDASSGTFYNGATSEGTSYGLINPTQTSPLYIGSDVTTLPEWSNIVFGDITLYNRVLTSPEITDLLAWYGNKYGI